MGLLLVATCRIYLFHGSFKNALVVLFLKKSPQVGNSLKSIWDGAASILHLSIVTHIAQSIEPNISGFVVI